MYEKLCVHDNICLLARIYKDMYLDSEYKVRASERGIAALVDFYDAIDRMLMRWRML